MRDVAIVLKILKIFINFPQELFHPQELQAMVIGNENYDFHEFEKVRNTNTIG